MREWFAKLPRPIDPDSLLFGLLYQPQGAPPDQEPVLPPEGRARRLLRLVVDVYQQPEILLARWGHLTGPGPDEYRADTIQTIFEIASSQRTRPLTRQAAFFLWGCCPGAMKLRCGPLRTSPVKDLAWLGALTEAFIELDLRGAELPPLLSALQILRRVGQNRKRPSSRLAAAVLGSEFRCENRKTLGHLLRGKPTHREIYEEAQLLALFFPADRSASGVDNCC